jgi:O-methyltransferase
MTPEWFHRVSYSALADTPSIQATYDLARCLIEQNVPGDFVECGVYAGAQAAMMARAILDAPDTGDERKVHLFDCFEGVPLAGPEDDELKGKAAGEAKCSLSAVMENMRAWKIPARVIVYHPGLFERTVPLATRDGIVKEIAFLRLDGDLYRSTTVCMEHLYPKVQRGGWVCVDDFNLSGCRKAVLETVVPAPIYWRVPTK